MQSFLKGIANIIGAWAIFFDTPEPASETMRRYLGYDATDDAEALQRDWEAVGADMWTAVEQFEQEQKTNGRL